MIQNRKRMTNRCKSNTPITLRATGTPTRNSDIASAPFLEA